MKDEIEKHLYIKDLSDLSCLIHITTLSELYLVKEMSIKDFFLENNPIDQDKAKSLIARSIQVFMNLIPNLVP